MPSLIRFLVSIGIVVSLVYGAMYAIVLYVEPKPRLITDRVPTDKINPVRQAPVSAPTPATDEETDAGSDN